MVKVEWSEGALKDLDKLDAPIVRRVLSKITWLSHNFETVVPEPLTGELRGTFKLRVGAWRVVYTMEGKKMIIQFVGHRREIYRVR